MAHIVLVEDDAFIREDLRMELLEAGQPSIPMPLTPVPAPSD